MSGLIPGSLNASIGGKSGTGPITTPLYVKHIIPATTTTGYVVIFTGGIKIIRDGIDTGKSAALGTYGGLFPTLPLYCDSYWYFRFTHSGHFQILYHPPSTSDTTLISATVTTTSFFGALFLPGGWTWVIRLATGAVIDVTSPVLSTGVP